MSVLLDILCVPGGSQSLANSLAGAAGDESEAAKFAQIGLWHALRFTLSPPTQCVCM